MSLSLRLLAIVAVLLIAGACGQEPAASSGSTVAVTATDESCELSETELKAGPHTFEVTNEGSEVTEFYVYGEGDEIVQEVEDIGPGVTREMQVELDAGEYEGACKPGMVGHGIRTPFTVTGA